MLDYILGSWTYSSRGRPISHYWACQRCFASEAKPHRHSRTIAPSKLYYGGCRCVSGEDE
eukprot:scaffold7686_cov154-Ochromonas_danica.AAC.5